MAALKDPDPHVQAHIASQLRGRGIPGALPTLLEMVDSRHAVVRKAARDALAEFSFRRYLRTFDMLDENVRQSTGLLVKKIDPQTVPGLKEELLSPARTHRLRAIAIARLIGVVEPLEEIILTLLSDEDHMVRIEAVAALAQSASPASRMALERALSDRSEGVRHTAQRSLQERARRASPSRITFRLQKSEAMYPPLDDCLLLAERGSRLNQFSESFKGHGNNVDNGEMVTGLLILAGIAALVWLLSRLMGGKIAPRPPTARCDFFSACARLTSSPGRMPGCSGGWPGAALE